MYHSLTSPEEKAFAINRDTTRYGTFAEIGAGQEVARWFFKVGGAAGTIAKTMSAYDMVVSDAIYGESKQYVSRERLGKMLEHEYDLLIERLKDVRGDNTLFFVYANTVRARSYRGTGNCNGWMGIRLQLEPHAPPNQIIIHIWMHDSSNFDQQDAIGIAGVNLIYGAINQPDPSLLVCSLLDALSTQRIEIDMIEFSGPGFCHIDNREMNLELVRHRLTNSVIFDPNRSIYQASEVLYKKTGPGKPR
jgi:hypothetical protein